MTLGLGVGELEEKRTHWGLAVIMATSKVCLRVQEARNLGFVGVDPSKRTDELRGVEYEDRKGTMRNLADMNNVSEPALRDITHLPKVLDPLLIP